MSVRPFPPSSVRCTSSRCTSSRCTRSRSFQSWRGAISGLALLACVVGASLTTAGCAGLSSSPLGVAGNGAALLEGRSVDDWSSRLEPSSEVTGWQSIPWHPTYHEGALAAAADGKPLLLWLMNGHPLGCT